MGRTTRGSTTNERKKKKEVEEENEEEEEEEEEEEDDIPDDLFKDCTISIAGTGKKATYYKPVITGHGGAFSATVTKKVTHLLASKQEFDMNSAKIKSAQKNGIPILSEDWFEDSISKKVLQNEAKYRLDAEVSSGSSAKKLKKEKGTTIGEEEEEEDEDDYFTLDDEDLFFTASKEIVEQHRSMIMSLLGEPEYADVHFSLPPSESSLKSVKLYGHHWLISKRCPKMAEMIETSADPVDGIRTVIISDIRPDIFQLLLEVVYTGKASPSIEQSFELLKVCGEYGLKDFVAYLQVSIFNKNNVWKILMSSYENKRDDLFSAAMKWIQLRAGEAFANEDFLLVPANLMVEILSSDKLSIAELDLFETMIGWADGQIKQDLAKTSKKSNNNLLPVKDAAVEFKLLDFKKKTEWRKKILTDSGVLSKIRFGLIDAEELKMIVELYGVVPDNIMLQAYRATLQIDKGVFDSALMKPRGIFFVKSVSFAHIAQLKKYLKPYRMKKVLYRASKHGFDNAKFHKLCDNKGPTVTIAILKNGKIFGGFTSLPWTSAFGQYMNDPKSFLFKLSDGSKTTFEKYKVHYPNNAIYCNSSYGPSFGAGHDLYLNLSAFNTSYSNLGNSYTFKPPKNAQQPKQKGRRRYAYNHWQYSQNELAGSYNNWIAEDVLVISCS